MNWKRLLYFDLKRLLPGLGPRGAEPAEPWVARRLRQRRERAGMAVRYVNDLAEDYKPCQYYRLLSSPRWRGPVYLTTSHWRAALVHVLGQMESMAEANANFVKGFEVAAAEEHRLHKGARVRRLWNAARAAVPSLFVAAVAFISCIRILEKGDIAAVALFFTIMALAAVPGWYMLMRNERLEALLLAMRDRLANGASISEVMRSLPRLFPPFVCDYVAAGESCGQLPQVLRHLNGDTVRVLTQGRYIRLQFWYLGLVLAAQLLLTTFIVWKVAPVMIEIVGDMGMSPPAPLRMIEGILEDAELGRSARRIGVILPVALLIGYGLIRKMRYRPLATGFFGAPMLLVPWLRGLFMQQNLSLAAFMLEKLLRIGTPLDQALATVAASGMHPYYQRLFGRARERILQGESLGYTVERESRLLPGSFRALVRIGERSGLLPESLRQLHETYQREVEKRTRMLVDIFVPVGVLALGALTLTVELSLFLVLAGLADTMSSPTW